MTNSNESLEILRNVQRAEAYTKPWHNNITRWRKLYNLEHYQNKANKRETQFNDPTYTNTVDLAVGIMLANSITWNAFGFSPSKAEQKDTGNIEKMLTGILSYNDEVEEALQMYELILNFVRDGGGVIYSIFDAETPKKLVDYPDEEKGSVQKWTFGRSPIRMQVIDPMKFFGLPGGKKRWLLTGRREIMTVADVEAQFQVKVQSFSHLSLEEKAVTRGEFRDVWDYAYRLGENDTIKLAIRNTQYFETEVITEPSFMDGYEDLPYTVQFFKPVSKDAKDWHSIVSPLESTVPLMEKAFNRRQYQIDVYSGLPLIAKTQPGRQLSIDTGLYNAVQMSTDESLEFPEWPGSSPDVDKQIELIRSKVQQSGFSDVMFGSGNNSSAGYALSQLGDQNRIRLEQPINHMELLLTSWAKKSLNLIQTFAEGACIYVYGKQRGVDYASVIHVEDMEGYEVRAIIKPNFPNEEQRKVAMATQVKGILSDYTISQRYLDIEQPEDENKRKLIEMVSVHPAAIQYAVMAELQEMAEAGDKVAAMTLTSMQTGGIAGTPGRPGEGPNPAQLTGTQSPNGLPVPQAEGGAPYGTTPAEQQSAMANSAPPLMG